MRTKEQQNNLIVNCAIRIAKKLKRGEYRTLNGEYSPEVKREIQRMKDHCNMENNDVCKKPTCT